MGDRGGVPESPRGATRPSWLLVGWSLLVLAAWLGTRGLNEPDEGSYAEIGREMARGSDWVLPHLNGFPHFQKPPLIYWATAMGFKLLGVNEWGARLPSALAAFGTVLATWAIGRRLFSASIATTAALVLLGGLEFFGLARLLTPDMLMTFWITASIACLVHAAVPRSDGGGASPGWKWAFFVCQGLGFMTKGPMALVVPAGAAVGWGLAARRSGGDARLPWVRGLLLALAIGLAWFVVISIRVPGLLDYFVGDELVKRVASKAHGRSKPIWFFIPVLVGGAMPWTAFFPWVFHSAWTRFRQRTAHPLAPWQGLLLGWTVIPFVVLSLSGSKLLTYVLPLYPALALAVAVAWDRHVSQPTRAGWWSWRVAALLLVGITSALVGVRFTRFGGSAPVWPLVMVVALVVWTVLERWSAQGRPDLSRLAAAASAVWIAVVIQVPALNGILGRQASVRDLAATARGFAGPDGAVFSYDVRACGFGFYLDRVIGIRASEADLVLKPTAEESRRLIDSASAAAQLAGPGRRVCGITTREHWGTEFTKPEWEELGRAGAFVLIGRQNPPAAR